MVDRGGDGALACVRQWAREGFSRKRRVCGKRESSCAGCLRTKAWLELFLIVSLLHLLPVLLHSTPLPLTPSTWPHYFSLFFIFYFFFSFSSFLNLFYRNIARLIPRTWAYRRSRNRAGSTDSRSKEKKGKNVSSRDREGEGWRVNRRDRILFSMGVIYAYTSKPEFEMIQPWYSRQ